MTVIDSFRTAIETGDRGAATAGFAADVVLHSPAVISTDYRGRDLVAQITGMAMQTLSGIRITDELHGGGGDTHALVFEGNVGDEPAQGVFHLATRDGEIVGLTLLLRPLRAVQAFVETMRSHGAQPAIDHARGVR
ncbi:MAG TPA: nuclear transport factor 2 family protein [Candidatus Dormibacteraeota bacterium]